MKHEADKETSKSTPRLCGWKGEQWHSFSEIALLMRNKSNGFLPHAVAYSEKICVSVGCVTFVDCPIPYHSIWSVGEVDRMLGNWLINTVEWVHCGGIVPWRKVNSIFLGKCRFPDFPFIYRATWTNERELMPTTGDNNKDKCGYRRTIMLAVTSNDK